MFRRLKSLFSLIIWFLELLPYKFRVFLWKSHRNNKGNYGLAMRYCILKTLAKECGDNVYIASNTIIKNFQNISFGNNVSIHEFCYIDGLGGLEIGNDVSVAHSSSIITFEHTYSENTQPIKYNELYLSKVSISEDVWIACGVRILAGAVIGKRNIVAANSVLQGKVYPPNSLIAGVPAKVKKDI